MKKFAFALILTLAGGAALAKIPAPQLTDEAKAKAAEAAAKTAWSGKVDAFQLCRAQDRVSAHAIKWAKAAGKELKAVKETPPCADPGAFVYVPAPPAAPVVAGAAPAAPAVAGAAPAPAATASAPAKKS
jgi:hypothetical protein